MGEVPIPGRGAHGSLHLPRESQSRHDCSHPITITNEQMVNPELRKPVSALSKYVTEPGKEPGLRFCLFTPSGFPETPRAAAPVTGSCCLT